MREAVEVCITSTRRTSKNARGTFESLSCLLAWMHQACVSPPLHHQDPRPWTLKQCDLLSRRFGGWLLIVLRQSVVCGQFLNVDCGLIAAHRSNFEWVLIKRNPIRRISDKALENRHKLCNYHHIINCFLILPSMRICVYGFLQSWNTSPATERQTQTTININDS